MHTKAQLQLAINAINVSATAAAHAQVHCTMKDLDYCDLGVLRAAATQWAQEQAFKHKLEIEGEKTYCDAAKELTEDTIDYILEVI